MAADIVLQCGRDTGPVADYLARSGVTMRINPDWEGIDRWALSQRAVVQHFDGDAFVNAITDRTLFVHAIELTDAHDLVIFIMSGEVPEHSDMHPNALRGAMSALPIQYGVTLLSATDEAEAARLIRQMAEHEQFGVPEISLHPKRKADDLPDMQRRVAEMLPGCGMHTARNLLRHFRSLRAAATATQTELMAVSGIGDKTAPRIHAVWAQQYLDIDWESDIEDAIVSNPELLFTGPIEILDRQHRFPDTDGQPLIPDIIAADPHDLIVYMVELKRGPSNPADLNQLRRYLDNAAESELLAACIDGGWHLRGILASPEPPRCLCEHPDITIVTLSREHILAELRKMAKQ